MDMTIWKPVPTSQLNVYNATASHPMQSSTWGDIRASMGIEVIRRGEFKGKKMIQGYQMTIHRIPHTPFSIGYIPKSQLPDASLLQDVRSIASQKKCIFIKYEPHVLYTEEHRNSLISLSLVPSAHPLFTPYTFILDLTRDEQTLLREMHPKARYNIRLAKKHLVTVTENNSLSGFEQYWKLMEETTQRQKFSAHTRNYHETVFRMTQLSTSDIASHLLIATYTPTEGADPLPLTAWMLFGHKNALYYPYGASTQQFRHTMSSSLVMWEAIQLGKRLKYTTFDLWGALSSTPDKHDPWFGFHQFKERFGAQHIRLIGSFDDVLMPRAYQVYGIAHTIRQFLLRNLKI
jgi:lipid II:glycine glycyltransferase (peptidoglycan interpeptide bridge formation enzyme)